MRAAAFLTTILVALLVATPGPATEEPVRSLRIGDTVTVSLPPDPGASLFFELPASGGPITIEAASFDFDTKLAVFRGEEQVAEDDDSLVGSNSRVTLASKPGLYRVVVSSSGDFEPEGDAILAIVAGESAPLDGKARLGADAEYWRVAEERAVARENPVHRARALSGRAAHLYQMGEPAEALALCRQSLALLEARYGPDDRHVGMVEGDTGLFLMLTGNLEEAETVLRRSLATLEKTVAADDPRIGTTLNTLGTVLSDLGDLPAARDVLERTLRIREKVYGPSSAPTATAINNLASVLEDMGRQEEALVQYRRALSIYEATYGPEHVRTASMVNNIGHVLRKLGRFEEARPYYERALAIREKNLGTDHPLYALSLQNLAMELHDLGESERALELLRQALAIREKRLGPDHPDVSITVANLAAVLHDLGRDEEAFPLSERSLEIRRKRFGPSSSETARALAQRSRLLASLGRREEALDAAIEAEAIGREQLRTTTRYLPERQALRYASVRAGGLDAGMALAADGKVVDVSRLWDGAIRSRSLVLDEMATRVRSLRLSGTEATRLAREDLDRAVSRYTRAVYGGGATAAEIEAARSAKDESERALAATSEAFREELLARSVGYREVAAALPARTALVALARYDVPRRGATPGFHAYVAFVLRAGDAAPSRAYLGDAAAIDDLVAGWRAAIEATATADVELGLAKERVARAKGEKLRALVWDPVAALTGSAETVFLVPDGSLNLVPFGALPVASSRYLVETGPRIHVLSAERDLARLASVAPSNSGLLAMGGPSFDLAAQATDEKGPVYRGATASCAGFRSLKFRALPLAGKEAADVAAVLRSPRTTVLTGAQASEAAFKRLAPGSATVHLATHGFVVSDRCGDEASDLPLQLSGLALAGANQRATAKSDGEDGILTAEEVASMDLTGVRWVALSACDTGVGPVASGEGVLGLRRAFAVAGARTLILTLWRVDDRDARRFMRSLYEARSKGADTPRAMREVALDVLRERRARGLDTSPLHWGGFAAAGDWR